MNVAPVSHRVALCGEFPTEVGKTPTDRLSSPVSGVFRTEKDRAVYVGLRSFDRVEREAGERGGAVKRLPPRFTADGNADRTRVFDGYAPKNITAPYFTL